MSNAQELRLVVYVLMVMLCCVISTHIKTSQVHSRWHTGSSNDTQNGHSSVEMGK